MTMRLPASGRITAIAASGRNVSDTVPIVARTAAGANNGFAKNYIAR